ncbi:DNA repair protein XRCC3 [Sergentomyia squamirostris]
MANRWNHWKTISFGCETLNDLLGGLPYHGITEIYGESGSGKSQICMQLCVTAQLPPELGGTGKGVVYLSTTGGIFPSGRLQEISRGFQEKYPNLSIDFMNRVFLQQFVEAKGLINCVTEQLKSLLKRQEIGLVIVDSMGVFRPERNKIFRAATMRNLVSVLKDFADKYNFAIVCVNEVTSIPNSQHDFVPSLGLAWANLINTRLKTSKTNRTTPSGHTVRIISRVHKNLTIKESAEFIITKTGICNP